MSHCCEPIDQFCKVLLRESSLSLLHFLVHYSPSKSYINIYTINILNKLDCQFHYNSILLFQLQNMSYYQTRPSLAKNTKHIQSMQNFYENELQISQLTQSVSSVLHKPCPKDLRVSYIQQYQQIHSGKQENSRKNKPKQYPKNIYNFQIDKSRTRDALKDITQKYGFDWDQNGKLIKKDQKHNVSRKSFNQYGYERKNNSLQKVNKTQSKFHVQQIVKTNHTKSFGIQMEEEKKVSVPIRKKRDYLGTIQGKLLNNQNNQESRKENNIQCKQVSFRNNYSSAFDQKQIDNKINKIWQKYHARTEAVFNEFKQQKFDNKIIQKHMEEKTVEKENYNSKGYRQHRNKKKQSVALSDKQLPHFGHRNFQLQNINRQTNNNSITDYKQVRKTTQKQQLIKTPSRSPSKSVSRTKIVKPEQYDSKIDQITQKIKKCQEQKQKLKINHKKFHYDLRSKTPTRIRVQMSPNFSFEKQKNNQYLSQRPKSCSPIGKIVKIDKQSRNIKLKKTTQNQQENIQRRKIMNQIQMENVNISCKLIEQTPIVKPIENSSKVYEQQIEIRKVQQIFHQLKNDVDNSSVLIKKICKQIELDQQFRNARAWFNKNDDPHKWGILADSLLAQHDIKLNYHQLVERFQNCSDEQNPFFSLRDCRDSYDSLISSYMTTQDHWNSQIKNKFSLECFEAQEFTSNKLDIENKGKIKIEDIVRYLNMKVNSFYRNRDIIIIFQRFAGKGKTEVAFSQILRVLAI